MVESRDCWAGRQRSGEALPSVCAADTLVWAAAFQEALSCLVSFAA